MRLEILNITNLYSKIICLKGYYETSFIVTTLRLLRKNFSRTFLWLIHYIGSLLCCIQLANWHNFLMSNQCKRVVPRRVTQQVLAPLSSLCCCCYSLSGAKHDSHINNFLTLISKGKKYVGCVLFTLLGNGKVQVRYLIWTQILH